jgi:aspartate aminotransferase
MNLKPSNRIENIEESSTLAMSAKASEMKSKGIDVISLSLGEPDFKTPSHICDGAKKAIDSGNYFSYPPVNGYLDLREAISKKFSNENNLDYHPNNIIVSNGVKQSITNVMFSLLNKGDEVIVFSPYWVSYDAIIKLADGIPIHLNGNIENDFKPSANDLEKSVSSKTKLIIFSSPCNPTGSVFTKDELESFSKVILKYNLYVISDEIYEHINFLNNHFSIGSLEGMNERTITLNGFSKAFAMTGWRLGYMGAPEWISKACKKMQGQTTSANCSIAQRAALIALNSGNKSAIEMKNEYFKRRDLVYNLLNKITGFKVNLPKGAFYFFPNIEELIGKSYKGNKIESASDLCMYYLNEAKVSLVPGEDFGAPNCIRLSYAASENNLIEAITRLKNSTNNLT